MGIDYALHSVLAIAPFADGEFDVEADSTRFRVSFDAC